MSVDIRPCREGDLPQLSPYLLRRFAVQQRGDGTLLLAFRGGRFAGSALVLARSKYDEVNAHLGPIMELNSLEAHPQGQGTGTALVHAAETLAREHRATLFGLAVEHRNRDARRLYERLGYASWGRGTVIDCWRELDGTEHADPCDYMTKKLGTLSTSAT
jgi:GNAT superfamily N-acetyltransferase